MYLCILCVGYAYVLYFIAFYAASGRNNKSIVMMTDRNGRSNGSLSIFQKMSQKYDL